MDAWLSVLRTVLTAGLTWLAAKGLVSASDVGPVVSGVVNAAPAVGIAIVAIWGAYQHTRAALITKTASLFDTAVVVTPEEKMIAHPDNLGVVSSGKVSSPIVQEAMQTGNK